MHAGVSPHSRPLLPSKRIPDRLPFPPFRCPIVPTRLCPFRFAHLAPTAARAHPSFLRAARPRFSGLLSGGSFGGAVPVQAAQGAPEGRGLSRRAPPRRLKLFGDHGLKSRLPQEPAPPATRQARGGFGRANTLPFGPEPRLRVLSSSQSGHQNAGRAIHAGQRRECPRMATRKAAPKGNSQKQEQKRCHPQAQPRKFAPHAYATKRNKRTIGAWLGL